MLYGVNDFLKDNGVNKTIDEIKEKEKKQYVLVVMFGLGLITAAAFLFKLYVVALVSGVLLAVVIGDAYMKKVEREKDESSRRDAKPKAA